MHVLAVLLRPSLSSMDSKRGICGKSACLLVGNDEIEVGEIDLTCLPDAKVG